MTTDNINLDFALLDQDLDSIEDLPGFEAPPTGEYLLRMVSVLKQVKDAVCVQTEYEVLECIKQDNDADTPAKVGNKFSSLYTIKYVKSADAEKEAENVKKGKGKLKELLRGVAEATGQGNLAVLVRDVVANCVVRATVKRNQDKEDKEKFYGNVKNLVLQ